MPHPDDTLLTFPACHAPLAAGAPDEAALQALDARTLGRWYANMAAGQASDGMPRRFGRYLFELVLGEGVWTQLVTTAAGAAIDVRIDCPPDAWALMRLPWELMHDGQHFLAARPGPLVLMSRQVTAPVAMTAPRTFAPRVFFVIGSLQDDAEIRAGAEYLGLLRRLQTLDLTLDCQVLREATAEMLQAAVADFQPSVVHFICHGGFSEGRGALRLLASDAGLPFQDYTAPQLLALLATTDAAGHVLLPAGARAQRLLQRDRHCLRRPIRSTRSRVCRCSAADPASSRPPQGRCRSVQNWSPAMAFTAGRGS